MPAALPSGFLQPLPYLKMPGLVCLLLLLPSLIPHSMNREEAIAKGIKIAETRPCMHRRMNGHDYSRRGTYMVTIVTQHRLPLFGHIVGRYDAPHGHLDAPHIVLSALGQAVMSEEIKKIPLVYPEIEVWKLCVMPDHLHILLRVSRDMPPKRHIGLAIGGFKGGCSKAAQRLGLQLPSPLFEPGYCDKILLYDEELEAWKTYLDDNPRRLLVKRQFPHLFTVLSDIDLAGRRCQMVGNRFLLDLPDKMAVIVHRRYTDEENARLRETWLACGERGGVLVSAAISPKEKEVLREAMDRDYRIILLRENGFPPLYKPSGEAFDACADGLLLQISPFPYHNDRKTITRSQCLDLNALAEIITHGH